MKLLITGGCGFLGSNLAANALAQKYELTVYDNLSRVGSANNLKWLQGQGSFEFVEGDIRDADKLSACIARIAPDAVFHLAGQVAMTTSIANPKADFEINALGTLNVLEAVRHHAKDAAVIYSSTNKVYGDLEQFSYDVVDKRYVCRERQQGFDESTPLDFRSPYGCSKGAADQYIRDYARVFGLNTLVFRHSSMYGGRQFATVDQGWVGWFCQKATEVRQGKSKAAFTISGNGMQVRDLLHADDMTALYFAALPRAAELKGNAFNIGGGLSNSLSLLELFDMLERHIDAPLNYVHAPFRASDQKVFIADTTRATQLLGWCPTVTKEAGVGRMLRWTEELQA